MVSDCGPGCEESRMTYSLEVEREWDGVRLWTQMQREQDCHGSKGPWLEVSFQSSKLSFT